ncbi:MAG: outer membrane beta-barrel protein [Bacteroidales bacterium]
MKKTRILLFAITMIACFASKSNAQINLGLDLGIAVPTTTSFSDIFKTGFGSSVIGEFFINKKMSVGVNFGYYSFTGNESVIGESGWSWTFVPITANYKFFFKEDGFKPYISAGLGLYALTMQQKINSYTQSYSENKFGLYPSIGFMIGEKIKWCANLKYNYVNDADADFISINAGAIFQLGSKNR